MLSVLSRDEIPSGLRLRITTTISSDDIIDECDSDQTIDEVPALRPVVKSPV